MYHCSQLAIAIRGEQWLDTKYFCTLLAISSIYLYYWIRRYHYHTN